ncbi:MAG TPA: zinc-ribbon domain-containing protein [Candidatus Nanoarchaeia archaeon]
MHCQECGKQNIDDAKFCRYCGAKVIRQTTTVVTPTAKEASNDPTYEDVMLEKVEEYANTEMTKGVLWFFGGIGITVVGLLFSESVGSSVGLVFWGAMLYGVIRLVAGIYYKLFPRKLMHKASYLERD